LKKYFLKGGWGEEAVTVMIRKLSHKENLLLWSSVV
jgi:hypothetical protein